jgi:transcriptional regulator with PAS, ATPase and Fis domain
MPESLIEGELFGHEKGAFTGAVASRAGCFELAHTGVLLLDEIGEMPISTQAKLLRVLEDSKVRRLGGKVENEVDVQVLAATNRDPDKSVAQGRLRMDVYYRLNVFHIALPPLRERKEDLPILVQALIGRLNEKYNCRVVDAEPEVHAALDRHPWPGNVRELRNVLARAVILAGEGAIKLHHLPAGLGGTPEPPKVEVQVPGDEIRLRVGTTAREAERALIEQTLRYTGTNKTRAAAILGIGLKTLHTKLKEYREESGRPPATDEEDVE